MKKNTKEIIKNLELLSQQEKENLLTEIRKEVEEIDRNILELLGRRAHHSRIIGKIKSSLHLSLFSSKRENEIFDKLLKNLESSLPKKSLIRIYERILDESRALQREEKDEQ